MKSACCHADLVEESVTNGVGLCVKCKEYSDVEKDFLDNMFSCLSPPDPKLMELLLDNDLNVRCSECNCWVSKIFVKAGKCPDCRRVK
jgi:hypothetical protein